MNGFANIKELKGISFLIAEWSDVSRNIESKHLHKQAIADQNLVFIQRSKVSETSTPALNELTLIAVQVFNCLFRCPIQSNQNF